MTAANIPLRVRLFYSYNHKDEEYRSEAQKTLALLRQSKVLDDWSDHSILPGQRISAAIRKRMDETDIFVFLLSRDFLASPECHKEWDYAAELAQRRPSIVRVPIILKRCPWWDLEGAQDLKALPTDANPITTYPDAELAWQQIYDGLSAVVHTYRTTFQVTPDFKSALNATDFISQGHIALEDIFVFPRLELPENLGTTAQGALEDVVTDAHELLKNDYVLLRGDALSGKTALCRHLFLTLAAASQPVLYFDLADATARPPATAFAEHFRRQYSGDYSLWSNLPRRILLLDNLTQNPRTLEYLLAAKGHFDKIVATVSSEVYFAFYRDEPRLAGFRNVRISPLTHSKQETLIRRRLAVSETTTPPERMDGRVDQLESRINAVVMHNRILPRYPFYILAILQTYEGFLHSNVEITSYSHCYRVLIMSYLAKSGISLKDDEVNACFNFAEHLAFERFQEGALATSQLTEAQLENFISRYNRDFIIHTSTLNRLCSEPFGLLEKNTGCFRSPYMYYFFLGRFLARNSDECEEVIQQLVERSHVTANYLILMFTIHHTDDTRILDDIVLRTKRSLEGIEPATLDRAESKMFENLVKVIPEEILSDNSIDQERASERQLRDEQDRMIQNEDLDEDDPVELVNDIYRIMKNNDVLGQILKNKYGVLRRPKLEEVVETIADGGLRLISLMVGHEKELHQLAVAIRKDRPEMDLKAIKQALETLAFLWTMMNVRKVVGALNGPEISELVEGLVGRKNTPAYDLIGYYHRLDTIDQLTAGDLKELRRMMKKHPYLFLRRVISLRTQHYLNTHTVEGRLEQAVCSELGIRYRARLKEPMKRA